MGLPGVCRVNLDFDSSLLVFPLLLSTSETPLSAGLGGNDPKIKTPEWAYTKPRTATNQRKYRNFRRILKKKHLKFNFFSFFSKFWIFSNIWKIRLYCQTTQHWIYWNIVLNFNDEILISLKKKCTPPSSIFRRTSFWKISILTIR